MLVIADTTPLNYLILIDAVDLLPRLYPQIILPRGAWIELQQPGTPTAVSLWARELPSWVDVREAPHSADPTLAGFGAGEREAILLAELYAPGAEVLLLLDEQAAREEARHRHLPVTGTLGILKAASQNGWIDLAEAFHRLRGTNFRASVALLEKLLQSEP